MKIKKVFITLVYAVILSFLLVSSATSQSMINGFVDADVSEKLNFIEMAQSTPGQELASGSCGSNLSWILETNGIFTISGTGEMEEWAYTHWYSYKDSIKTVIITNGITSISENAFQSCSNLTTVVIPDSVAKIGKFAFDGCPIEDITIPAGMTKIDAYAFAHCTRLKRIVIPKNITAIESGAFLDCSNLSQITIPTDVTSIENSAFQLCTNLIVVYYAGTEKQWNEIRIDEGGNDCLLNADISFGENVPQPEEPCKHDFAFVEDKSNSGIWKDLGDGTHVRISVIKVYKCVLCSYVEEKREAEKDFPPQPHSGVSTQKVLSAKKINFNKHEAATETYEICVAPGCGAKFNFNTVTKKAIHNLTQKKCNDCHCVLTDEEYYKYMLINSSDPMSNDLFTNVMYKRFETAGVRNPTGSVNNKDPLITDLLNTIKNSGSMYKNLYLWSFYDYDIAVSSSERLCYFSTRLDSASNTYTGTLTMRTQQITEKHTWFHESGHANQLTGHCNMYNTDDLSQISPMITLYGKLKNDVIGNINRHIDNALNSFFRNIIKPGSVTLTQSERDSIIEHMLSADYNMTDKDNATGDYTIDIPQQFENDSTLKTVYEKTVRNFCEELRSLEKSNSYMAQDIHEGMTNGVLWSNWGHISSNNTYWFKNNTPTYYQSLEAWAEFYSAKITNNTAAISSNNHYFPSACNLMETQASSILDYYKNKLQKEAQ